MKGEEKFLPICVHGHVAKSTLHIVQAFSAWKHLLCPQLTPEVRSGTIAVPSVQGDAASSLDSPQASRGTFIHCPCTTAGFTPVVLDGYGLRHLTLTRPTEAPQIQFLFVGSHVCSTLPSDTTSR